MTEHLDPHDPADVALVTSVLRTARSLTASGRTSARTVKTPIGSAYHLAETP